MDKELLARFFADHKEVIEDNGFTERVLNALPEREADSFPLALQQRHWSMILNVSGIIAVFALLIHLGFFSRVWAALQAITDRIVMSILHFDTDDLLVQLMLFIYRLPEQLPSPSQLLVMAIGLTTILVLAFQRIFKYN